MQYKISYNGMSAIVDSFGGELISFKDSQKTEYVWCGDKKYWSGHAPVLFPIVGALKNGKIKINEKDYAMPKHGLARKREFQLVSLNENSVHFVLNSSEEIKEIYPFDFELHIMHLIEKDGFSTTYKVVNTNTQEMIFCIGGHAGFCCPFENGENFENYLIEFANEEDCNPFYTDSDSVIHKEYRKENIFENKNIVKLDYNKFDNDVLIFDSIKSNKVTLKNTNTNNAIEFKFEGFNNLGIWTPPSKRAPFICFEPWQGLPAFIDETGNFEDKPGMITLKSDESYIAKYSMKI